MTEVSEKKTNQDLRFCAGICSFAVYAGIFWGKVSFRKAEKVIFCKLKQDKIG